MRHVRPGRAHTSPPVRSFRDPASPEGGALRSFETTVLLSVDETLDALRQAEGIGCRPPGA